MFTVTIHVLPAFFVHLKYNFSPVFLGVSSSLTVTIWD